MLPPQKHQRARKQRTQKQPTSCKPQPLQTPQFFENNDQDPWCDLYNDGYSHQQVDKIMDMYSPGDDLTVDTRYDKETREQDEHSSEDEEDVVPIDTRVAPPAPAPATSSTIQTNTTPSTRTYEPFLQTQSPHPSSSYIELGIYVISGMLLIIMMEQFVQIGMNIRH